MGHRRREEHEAKHEMRECTWPGGASIQRGKRSSKQYEDMPTAPNGLAFPCLWKVSCMHRIQSHSLSRVRKDVRVVVVRRHTPS